ncbi:hypothetical protein PHYPSEUDO_011520 [Phytophthora pseudosyringae]|uniref:Uncharacterized protein n=1 Tax=Phytophthora pseudosyringae TaxID=221518 RepID=A0A8T1V892_9STRA|nr:hypothetical protein PHYPSEUDO_011520 [Phytophthora pseudosyringae]
MPTNSAERRRYMFDHAMHALSKISADTVRHSFDKAGPFFGCVTSTDVQGMLDEASLLSVVDAQDDDTSRVHDVLSGGVNESASEVINLFAVQIFAKMSILSVPASPRGRAVTSTSSNTLLGRVAEMIGSADAHGRLQIVLATVGNFCLVVVGDTGHRFVEENALVTRLMCIEENGVDGGAVLGQDGEDRHADAEPTLGEQYGARSSRTGNPYPCKFTMWAEYTLQHYTLLPVYPTTKRIVKLKDNNTGEIFRSVKGAPQVVLDMNVNAETLRVGVENRIYEFASRGYRCLGIAATVNVAQALVAPAVLVVADQIALWLGRQCRLPRARQAEEVDDHEVGMEGIGHASKLWGGLRCWSRSGADIIKFSLIG